MANLDPGSVSQITAVHIGRIGDLITGTPFRRSLNQYFAKARIRLVVHAQSEEAAALIPFVDDVQTFHRIHKATSNLKLAANLVTSPCDLLVDLNPSFSRTSSALSALVRAPVKLAFKRGRLDSVFTDFADAPGDREHMLDRYGRLAAALSAPYAAETELRLNPADETRADRILNGTPHEPGGKLIAIHPGNFKKFDNRWPEEKFAALTNELLDDPNLRIFYMAGPGEEEAVHKIIEMLKRPVPMFPPTPLGVTGALLRKMDLAVLNITGTTHLAAALKVPTFGFYSGYTNTVWRPRGAMHTGVVSKSWESCRDIGVDEALEFLKPRLAGA